MITLQQIGELYGKTALFQTRLERARQIVIQAFAQCEKPYLSLSGGKDSVAMLGVVESVARSLNRTYVLFAHVSDASFPGTVETIQACAKKVGRRLFLDESPVSAYTVKRDKVVHLGKKGIFFDSIRSFIKVHNCDLAFVGVRAAESGRRKKACQVHGPIFSSNVLGKQIVCFPLIWFSVEDVCAAIAHYELPFHPIYSKEHPSGDPREIRLGYTTAKDLMQRGTVVFIKHNYPEIFNKLIQAFPEMSNYG